MDPALSGKRKFARQVRTVSGARGETCLPLPNRCGASGRGRQPGALPGLGRLAGCGGGVFRSDHLRLGWQSFDLDTKKTERLTEVLRESIVHAQVKDPVICLRTPDERSHREALDAEIRAALAQGKDAASALRDAVQRWQKLDAGKSPAARLAEYRLSLGLSRAN